MKFDLKVFAERVSELRKERKLTITQLADAVGVSHPTISRWENVLIMPQVDNIFALAIFFNVPAGYLIGTEN